MRAPRKNANDVPDADHVARFCHPQRGVIRDPITKEIKGLYPEAFALRVDKNEQYLSMNHFEHFGPDVSAQFTEVLKVLRSKFTNPKHAIARLNTKKVRDCGGDRHEINVRKRGDKRDPSYVHCTGLPLDNSDRNLLIELAKSYEEIREIKLIEP